MFGEIHGEIHVGIWKTFQVQLEGGADWNLKGKLDRLSRDMLGWIVAEIAGWIHEKSGNESLEFKLNSTIFLLVKLMFIGQEDDKIIITVR